MLLDCFKNGTKIEAINDEQPSSYEIKVSENFSQTNKQTLSLYDLKITRR